MVAAQSPQSLCDPPSITPTTPTPLSDGSNFSKGTIPPIRKIQKQPVQKIYPLYREPGKGKGCTFVISRWRGEVGSSLNFHRHRIYFKNGFFTMDGKIYRDVKDPANASFLKSLEEGCIPDEFKEDGKHIIMIFGDKDWVKPSGVAGVPIDIAHYKARNINPAHIHFYDVCKKFDRNAPENQVEDFF